MAKDVIIALDFENKEKTLAFLDQFTGRKPFVKIGMELFYAEGPSIVKETTGPSGRSSIAFRTGSVVVPFTSDTMAKSCPVIALIMLDFPALRFPNIPMCKRSDVGV